MYAGGALILGDYLQCISGMGTFAVMKSILCISMGTLSRVQLILSRMRNTSLSMTLYLAESTHAHGWMLDITVYLFPIVNRSSKFRDSLPCEKKTKFTKFH